jgi:sirohydrochlorin ferrochelatase
MTSPAATELPVVVLVAHGSRVEAANSAHRDLARSVADRSGATVIPAYLELAEPDVGRAIDLAVESGAGHVTVLPYFLLPGAHTTVDIPAIIDAARLRHPTVELTQAPHLGADPALVDALVSQVDRLEQ